MSRKLITRILIGLVVVLVGIQLIRPSRKVPPIDVNREFVLLAGPPDEIRDLVKTACYDCHSYETKYPWYANIAPVSWWVSNHIHEGREHLNFSTWGNYTIQEQAELADESAEEVEEGHMPDGNYARMHSVAQLSDAQRSQLVHYFSELAIEMKSIPQMPTFMPPPSQ